MDKSLILILLVLAIQITALLLDSMIILDVKGKVALQFQEKKTRRYLQRRNELQMRVRRDNLDIAFKQIARNKSSTPQIYSSKQFRPRSSSLFQTHQYKKDLYMLRAKERLDDISLEKKKQVKLPPFKGNILSDPKTKNMQQRIIELQPNIEIVSQVDLLRKYSYSKPVESLNGSKRRKTMLMEGDNISENFSYVQQISENNDPKRVRLPLNAKNTCLNQLLVQKSLYEQTITKLSPIKNQLSPIKNQLSPIKNQLSPSKNKSSPTKCKSQAALQLGIDENMPLTGKTHSSPLKREKNDQDEFEVFQKQTFFEKLRLKFGHSSILSMKYSPDDQLLAFSQQNGKVTIFNDLKGIEQQSFREKHACTSVRWNPLDFRQQLLEGYSNGCLKYRQIRRNFTNKVIHIFEEGEREDQNNQEINAENKSINCLEFMESGNTFLSGGSDSVIREYDIQTGRRIRNLKYHKNRIFAIKHIDDQCFLSAGWDHTVYLYDLRAQKVQKYIYGPMVFGDSLDFRNYEVLCGSWRETKQLQLFDLRNDKCEEIKWENVSQSTVPNFVYCCQFSKVNNRHIVAGSTGKHELRVFDRDENNSCVDAIDRTLTKGVFSLDFRNHSNHLSFGTSDASYGLVEIM